MIHIFYPPDPPPSRGREILREKERRMGVAKRTGGWFWVMSIVCAAVCLWASASFPLPRAYVSNEKSNDLTVIDTATDTVIATVPVG